MPETGNIKTFTSPIDRLTPTDLGAQSYEMMGRHVEATYASAGQKIASGMGAVGEAVEQHDDTVQAADVMKKMSDLEVQAHADMLSARTTMDPNDPDAVNKFMGKYDQQLSDITSGTYTTKVTDMVNRLTNDFNARTRNTFTGYQSEAVANQALANFNQSTDNFANLANRDPNFVSVGVDAVKMAAQNLPAEHRAEYELKNTQHIYDSAGEGVTSRVEGMKTFSVSAVDAAKSYLLDPKNGFVDGMSSPKFAEIMNRLDNLRRTGGTQTIAGMELNGPAMVKNISFTGQAPADFTGMVSNLRALGTPEGEAAAEKWEQRAQDARGEYGARQIINQTPADKLAEAQDTIKNATLRSDLPGGTISTVQATDKAFNELLKQRREAFSGADPAKQGQWEIDNNPSVRQAYDAWRKNPDDPKAFQNYYMKSVGDQRFLEPGSLPSVVTADIENDASRIQHEIINDPKAGPLQAAQDFARMARTYGPAWPTIAGDLAKKKIFNGDQLVAAGLIQNPSAQGWVRPLLQGSTMSSKQREEYSGMSDSKAEALVRDHFAPLIASMGNINNAPQLIDTYISAAAKIAQMGKLDDAYQMVKTSFLDQFQFVGPGGSIRLSADVPNGDAIGDGARSVLHDIGNHDLVVPFSASLGSVNAKEAFADAIKANGQWNTSRNGKTAILYDGAGNPVMENRNGKQVPVEIAFDELARLGGGGNTKSVAQSTIETEEAHVK